MKKKQILVTYYNFRILPAKASTCFSNRLSLYTKINKVEIILILYDKMPLLTIRYSEHREKIVSKKCFKKV